MARLRYVQNARTGSAGTLCTGNLDITGDLAITGNITVTGSYTYGSGAVPLSQSLMGTLTVGVDDTGYDVKFYGAGTGKYWLWDESADGVVLVGSFAQTGAATISSTLGVTGNTTVGGTLGITGNTTVGGTFSVTGATTLSSTVAVAGKITMATTTAIDFYDSGASIQASSQNTLALTGTNITLAGIVGITGATTITGAVTIAGANTFTSGSGAVTLSGAVGIGADTTIATTSKVQFRDTGLYLYSSVDGQLDLIADTKQQITSPTIDLEASTGIVLDGNVSIDGIHTLTSGTGAVALNGSVTVATAKTLTITDNSGLIIAGTAVAATAAEINRAADASARIINLTAATLSITEATHDGAIITINKADGAALTLPAATGSGAHIRLFIGTTITSNTTTIKVADATDIMYGAIVGAIDAGTTNNFWLTAADSDTITFDGTTKGGYIGDQIELIDVATNAWLVNGFLKQTGTEATPFSATVV